jgi:hypothetical protein
MPQQGDTELTEDDEMYVNEIDSEFADESEDEW